MNALRLPVKTPDETLDIYSSAVALCERCNAIAGPGFPLWGAHLHAALMLHTAHRLVEELCAVPALTDTDRRLGRRIGVIEENPR